MRSWPSLRALCAALIGFSLLTAHAGQAAELSKNQLETIGKKIWLNECGGRVDGLTSWNTGEQFASLGIGHFIWYPKGYAGPFDEAFPRLAKFLAAEGAAVPEWAQNGACPWSTKEEFQREFRGARMQALRDLLVATVPLQTRFIVQRMEASLPKMLEAAPEAQRENVKAQFRRMLATGAGTFALIDYVNFKGEGIKETERYQGQGWGLLQVLAGMKGSGAGAVKEFAASAEAALTRRVENSPPARGEKRWLAGWKNRVRRYLE